MKKIIIPFICLAIFSAPVCAQTSKTATVEKNQKSLTAKQVLDRYFEALGGKQNLENVKSVIIEGTTSVQGKQISTITKKMGNKFRSENNSDGRKMLQVFDGQGGYVKQLDKEANLTAEQIKEFKKGNTVDALALDKVENMKFLNTEKINGISYNVLTSDKSKFYFDANTGLLYKTVVNGAEVIIKDYITQNGIKFPGTTEIKAQGQQIIMKNNKITLNSGVTEADFK